MCLTILDYLDYKNENHLPRIETEHILCVHFQILCTDFGSIILYII